MSEDNKFKTNITNLNSLTLKERKKRLSYDIFKNKNHKYIVEDNGPIYHSRIILKYTENEKDKKMLPATLNNMSNMKSNSNNNNRRRISINKPILDSLDRSINIEKNGMPLGSAKQTQSCNQKNDNIESNLNAKISSMASLYYLSVQYGYEEELANENVIQQLSTLYDTGNIQIFYYIAAVLVNITTNSKAVKRFLNNDGISTLLEVSWSPINSIKILCATALCRLSTYNEAVNILVESQAIVELTSMMGISNDVLKILCLKTISNIIYYKYNVPERHYAGKGSQHKQGIILALSELCSCELTIVEASHLIYNFSFNSTSASACLYAGITEVLLALCQNAALKASPIIASFIAESMVNLSYITDTLNHLFNYGPKILFYLLSLNEISIQTCCLIIIANLSFTEDFRVAVTSLNKLFDEIFMQSDMDKGVSRRNH